MKRLPLTLACALVIGAGAANADRIVVVEAPPPSSVLLTEQTRNGVPTGHPTLVEVRPGYGLVDRSAVIDARPGEIVELRRAVPVPRSHRVGPSNSATNPSGTELAGQNGGQ